MSQHPRALFLVVAPESNPEQHCIELRTPALELRVVAVADYQQAQAVAQQCVSEGFNGIELCAGFGNEGVARVTEAVGADIPVGVVRFDRHPLMANVSGDGVFN